MELPSEERIRWLFRTSAWALERGAEPVKGLVEPSARFFPDKWDGSPASAERFARRVLRHAGLGDLAYAIDVVGEASTSSCGSGACATPSAAPRQRFSIAHDGYRLALAAGEVRNPAVLGAVSSRLAGLVMLAESDSLGLVPPAAMEPTAEVFASLMGFGALLANGAHVLVKGCGGLKAHVATVLPVEEHAVLVALFCKLFAADARAVPTHLDEGARAAFGPALRLVEANDAAVRLVRDDPALVASNRWLLAKPRTGLLARWFGSDGPAPRDAAPRPATSANAAKAKRLAELHALADEVLESR
jgi:hypothetical protein